MNKKAQFDPMSITILIFGMLASIPVWLWVIIAGLGIILLTLFWFALGKILGTFMILAGVYTIFKTKNWIAVAILFGMGLLFFVNPFAWERLSIMW